MSQYISALGGIIAPKPVQFEDDLLIIEIPHAPAIGSYFEYLAYIVDVFIADGHVKRLSKIEAVLDRIQNMIE